VINKEIYKRYDIPIISYHSSDKIEILNNNKNNPNDLYNEEMIINQELPKQTLPMKKNYIHKKIIATK
jgi:hypothetical protein